MNKTDDELHKELRAFLAKECSYNKPISSTTLIQDDLGVYGDDAVELLIAYSERYKVDISDFKASEYFDSDGIDIFSFILSLLNIRKKAPRKKLSVASLERGIHTGKLDEEAIIETY